MTATTLAGVKARRTGIHTLLGFAVLLALGAVAVAAVLAPTANAAPDRKLEYSFHLDELNIYDPYLTNACGFEVVGLVSGDFERKLELPKGKSVAARETSKFRGNMTWINRATGRSYSDKVENTSKIEYPQGIDLWLPAHVTVTGSHGGTFPVGDGPPGPGRFEYDAVIYATDWETGFPYIFVDGQPTWTGKSFDRATEKVCAALA
jgi:hypothetical protein